MKTQYVLFIFAALWLLGFIRWIAVDNKVVAFIALALAVICLICGIAILKKEKNRGRDSDDGND